MSFVPVLLHTYTRIRKSTHPAPMFMTYSYSFPWQCVSSYLMVSFEKVEVSALGGPLVYRGVCRWGGRIRKPIPHLDFALFLLLCAFWCCTLKMKCILFFMNWDTNTAYILIELFESGWRTVTQVSSNCMKRLLVPWTGIWSLINVSVFQGNQLQWSQTTYVFIIME